MKTIELPKIETLTNEQLRVTCAKGDGWTKIELYEDNAGPSFWSGMPPANFVETFRKEKTYGAKLPNYPEDANAALGLVASLKREGWECRLMNGFDDNLWECFFFFWGRCKLASKEVFALCQTFELAICRAYVLAKGLATK